MELTLTIAPPPAWRIEGRRAGDALLAEQDADDPQQPPALVVINLPNPHAFSRLIILAVRCFLAQEVGDTSRQGEPCLMRH